jgi:predicted enzyme related to lactoylglutathione lyase
MVGDVEFGFHPADESKNPKGSSTVPYWIVPNLSDAIELVKNSGGEHLRGPLRTDDARIIAQVRDPFGLVLGLEERG